MKSFELHRYSGLEFTSNALDRWAYEHKIILDFSRPGKPTDNGYIESFNSRFMDECLNVNWFSSLDDTRRKVYEWCEDYNVSRLLTSCGNLTPLEFSIHAGQLPGMDEPEKSRNLT